MRSIILEWCYLLGSKKIAGFYLQKPEITWGNLEIFKGSRRGCSGEDGDVGFPPG